MGCRGAQLYVAPVRELGDQGENMGRKLFDKNLKVFRKINPDIHSALKSLGKAKKNLVSIGDDDWDLIHEGKPFYGIGAKEFAKRQVSEFWKTQSGRVNMHPPQPGNHEPIVRDCFMSMLKRATDDQITFFENRCDLRSYYLVVLGSGMAEHLPALADLTECKSIIIVEPDIRLLHASLQNFDWGGLIGRFDRQKGFEFNLVMNVDPQLALVDLRSIIRNQRTPSFLDGLCVFEHYQADHFRPIKEQLFGDCSNLVAGLGFIFDEMNMVHNSYFNLRRGKLRIFQSDLPPNKYSAFVVGSGPSLDNDIDAIRAHAGTALVLSCGSSIAPLLDSGIVPDFHIECENVIENYEMLCLVAERHDISKIPLIAGSTVHPGMLELFDDVTVYFRRGLASYHLFSPGEWSRLANCTPTVTNAGTVFAMEVGCKDIYLFGVDLGSRESDKHHAASTPYNRGELDFEWHMPLAIQMPANFGGQSRTHAGYLEVKSMIEFVIRDRGADLEFFNCSDGLMIDGVTPLHSADIQIRDAIASKQTLANEILNRFPAYTNDQFELVWDGERRVLKNRECRDLMVKFLNAGTTQYNDVMSGLFNISDSLQQLSGNLREDDQLDVEMQMYRGSAAQALMIAHYFMVRTGNDADRKKIATIVRDEMTKFIENLFLKVDEFYGGLVDPKTAQPSTIFDER